MYQVYICKFEFVRNFSEAPVPCPIAITERNRVATHFSKKLEHTLMYLGQFSVLGILVKKIYGNFPAWTIF